MTTLPGQLIGQMRGTVTSAGYALVNAARRVRRHPRARLTGIIVTRGRADLPARLNPRLVYQLGEHAKWAVLACPCGRGHTLELNLASPARAQWTLTTSTSDQPSLHPSVDFKGDRRCHFWLRDGVVRWVADDA